jgi:hypothetical protein
MGMQVLDNTPSTGYIQWTDVGISYKGEVYNVENASTNLAYIYWKFADPHSFYGSNAFPSLGPDDLLVFLNKSGTHMVVPGSTILDGSLFVPGSIMAIALSANSVTSEKILAGAIDSTHISAGAIGAQQIAAGAILADKIAAGVIDASKIATNTLTANQIAANAITASELAANAVTATKILAGVIDATHIKAGAIGAAQIAAGAILADKIAAGVIDASKLSVSTLSAISANLGNVTAGSIKGVDISGSTLKVTNKPIWGDGTTFVQMKDGEIFVTDKNPDIVSRANADDVHINYGAIFMVGHDANGIGIYEIDLAPKYILFTELNPNATLKHQTNIRAEFLETPKVTSSELIVNGLASLNGNVAIGGQLTVAGLGSDLNMNNKSINNVNHLTFNDPGNNEGIEWLGGNGWKIQESPDDGSNAAGQLQFFTGTTRRATIGLTGNFYITGNRYVIQNSGGSFEAEGKLSLLNTTGGAEMHLGSDATSPYVQSITVFNRTYSPAANMYVTSSGVIGRTTSATKYKLEIDDSKVDPYKILDLNPKTWYDKAATEAYADALTREHAGEVVDWAELDIPQLERVSGLIAEDVIAAGLPEYATYEFNEDGTCEVEGLMYDRLWTLLIPVVRDQKEEITLLKEQVKSQDEKISNLEARLAALEAKINI